MVLSVSAFSEAITVQEYTGYQWQRMSILEKTDVVGGVLAGFSMVRDFIFDLDPNVYEKYKAYDTFMAKRNIIVKIIDTLDRYYLLNKENYKYDDRVTIMIIVIYSKYWWR